jgi:hypothetical protein
MPGPGGLSTGTVMARRRSGPRALVGPGTGPEGPGPWRAGARARPAPGGDRDLRPGVTPGARNLRRDRRTQPEAQVELDDHCSESESARAAAPVTVTVTRRHLGHRDSARPGVMITESAAPGTVTVMGHGNSRRRGHGASVTGRAPATRRRA